MRNAFLWAVGTLSLLAGTVGAQEQTTSLVMVFGEATFLESERALDEGFALGQLVGQLNASLDPRLSVFAEATITPRATTFSPSLERVIVRYDFRDWLKVSAGRYHTPISSWNTAYHHGSWLQPSIARPVPVGFSTPLIPIHFLGLLAEGTVPAGPVTVLYDVGVGNGRQETASRPGDAGDDNGSRAVVGGLRFRPLRLPGLEIGGHGYVDRVPTAAGEVDERILAAHASLRSSVEVIAEYLRIRNEPDFGAGGAHETDAWYVHVGYRLPPSLLRLRPYVRLERIQPDAGDPLFGAVEYDATVVGVRWDFSGFAALTGEYRSEEVPGDDGDSLLLNVAFVIPDLTGPR